jgi:uncharacterized protein (DUF885 family)
MKILFLLLAIIVICATVSQSKRGRNVSEQMSTATVGDRAFKLVHDKYVIEFLRRNPTVNTYLGGAGLDPGLREVDGLLRDHSSEALKIEDRWLEDMQKAFESINPDALSTNRRIDREVALAQINFLLHQHRVRRYQERALDTYTDEPIRAIDFQLQGLTETGSKTYGTPGEWALVVKRVEQIPHFLAVAQEQLAAGVKSGNTPDHRMLRRYGINAAEADAKYFETTLPEQADKRIAAGQAREQVLFKIRSASKQAAAAYRDLASFVMRTFFVAPGNKSGEVLLKPEFRVDHFIMGEAEYNWALKNNLRINKTAAQLYEEAWPIVQATRNEMMTLARRIGEKREMKLPPDGAATVRAVFDELSKEYPESDTELIKWYHDTSFRLIDYARKTGVFDVPADYKLDVFETPPPLQTSIPRAAYYPAPPLRNSGIGHFYLTPTGNNIAALKSNNRASVADTAAHEGFPGHDWHYKVMTGFREQIAPVRWLTPGAVEDSSSMWEDSMATEGWALYAEALMAESQPGANEIFYTPEERLYQLQGKLLRDLRVRIDIGLHIGRMSYDDAVDLFSEIVEFLPGKCGDTTATRSEAKRASCESAGRAIFRYSRCPTQAITYSLGKEEIYALREEAARLAGHKFSLKEFHLLLMRQGTIPTGYFRDEFLREIREKK